MLSHSRDERVAALYARVIHCVCERFEQLVDDAAEEEDDDDAARERRRAAAVLVQERWRDQMMRYTGHPHAALVPREHEEAVEPVLVASALAAELPRDVAHRDDGAADALGRPHALHQLRAPTSIFATILSGKRKIEQLDGTVDDASDDSDDDDDTAAADAAVAADRRANDETMASPSQQPPPTASLVSADIAPATALHVGAVPLQCAARDVSFAFRKNILRGRVKNIIVTLLRRVRADEVMAPKQLLWLTRPLESDDEAAPGRSGSVVEVVEVFRDSSELVVQIGSSARTYRVHMDDTRRFQECIVATGYILLRFVQG